MVLDDLDVVELSEVQSSRADEAYTLFHPSEIKLQQTVEVILGALEDKRPVRVVIDSLSKMRLMARDPLRFRRQILFAESVLRRSRVHGTVSG